METAANTSHYDGLGASEVATLVGLGMSVNSDCYLFCRFCRNNKRKELKFQGTDQVREHFQRAHGEVQAAATAADEAPQEAGFGRSM